MSLLEVLIALAILLLALVGISQVIGLSTEHAARVRDQGTAALRCQSKLAEVVAGVEPLQSQSEVAFEDDPAWTWSVLAEPRNEAANLWSVQVRVVRQNDDGTRTESVLNQLVIDPRQRGTPPSPADPSTTPPGGTTGTSGGTTPGGTTQPSGGSSQQPGGSTQQKGGRS